MRDPDLALASWYERCARAPAPSGLEVPCRVDARPGLSAIAVGLALAFATAAWTPAVDLVDARTTARYLAVRQWNEPAPLPPWSAILPRRPEARV